MERFLKWLGFSVEDKEYADIFASRRVIKNKDINTNKGWYKEDIWELCYERHKESLQCNIMIWGEIYGQTPSGQWIQTGYSYGTEPKDFGFKVFRIAFVNYDGKLFDFSWKQIKDYCNKYGLEHVPELYYGKVSDLFGDNLPSEEEFPDKFLELLTSKYLEKKLPEGVWDEGACIRNESTDYMAYKLKSFNFLKAESDALDKGDAGIEDEEIAA